MFFHFFTKSVTAEEVKKYGTDRIFWGLGTVDDGPDSDDEIMDFEESWKKSKAWHNNGGEILFEHQNKPVGKSLELAKTIYEKTPAILITAFIKKGNEFFDAIWDAVKKMHPVIKLNGLSMGGFKKKHTILCDLTKCRKKWHEFDVIEYSLVFDPSKASAIILGTYAKSKNGATIINNPIENYESIYEKGAKALTGKKKTAGKTADNKNDDCVDCPPEDDLKKSAGAQTGDNEETSVSAEELRDGIQAIVQNEMKDTLSEFTKSFTKEVGEVITEQFKDIKTDINSQIAELKKADEDIKDKEDEMEDDYDEEKKKEMEKQKKDSVQKFDLKNFVKIAKTPSPPGVADIRNNLTKSAQPKIKTWGAYLGDNLPADIK